MKILLEISYVGTNYHGYQFQKNANTIAQTLQNALAKLIKTKFMLTGCSRTDAGVHAKSFFCTVESEFITIPCERFPQAANSYLPQDICVKNAMLVDESFHVRYNAIEKEYTYTIHNSKIPDPFTTPFVWQIDRTLDERIMDRAAKIFVGEHDFAAFCALDSTVENTVRKIIKCEVFRSGEYVIIKIVANGFLYNMVRIIIGALVAVSQGLINLEHLQEILDYKIRDPICKTAPAKGLCLTNIKY